MEFGEIDFVTVKELSKYVELSENKVRRAVTTNRIPSIKHNGRKRGIEIELIDFFEENELKNVILNNDIIRKQDDRYVIERGYTPVELENEIFDYNSDYIRLVLLYYIEKGKFKEYKRASNLYVVAESQVQRMKEDNLLDDFDESKVKLEEKDFYKVKDLVYYTGFNYDKIYNAIKKNKLPSIKEKSGSIVIEKEVIQNTNRKQLIEMIEGRLSYNNIKEKDNQQDDEKIKVENLSYIYKIELDKTRNRLFPYTAYGDGGWMKVDNEIKKAKFLINQFTSFSEEIICDLDGKTINGDIKNEDELWFFTILPNIDDKLVLFTVHSRKPNSNTIYKYYISPVQFEWLEGSNVEEYQVSELEYAVDKFIEDNPQFSNDMEIVKSLIKDKMQLSI